MQATWRGTRYETGAKKPQTETATKVLTYRGVTYKIANSHEK